MTLSRNDSPKVETDNRPLATKPITAFAVLIRDEGYACHLCVEGVDNARWVVDRLSELFAFRTSEPMLEGVRPTQRTFRVAYGSQLSHRKLASLLSAIPGVRLTLDPTCGEAN